MASPSRPDGTAPRQARRWALRALLFGAPAAGVGLYMGLLRNGARTRAGPLRFTMQVEPPLLPELTFNDAASGPVTLQAWRGKVVLLNIWATWCPPCVKEMPSLDRLQEKLGGKDFEVIALSIDAGTSALTSIRSFYSRVGIRHLKVYHDPASKAGFTLGTVGVPTTLLVDRQGRELGRMTGVAEWDGPEALAFLREQIGRSG